MKLPIYNNREIVGYASSKVTATRYLKKTLQIMSGFTVNVWLRPDHICEINGLPKGWVYSIPHSSQTR